MACSTLTNVTLVVKNTVDEVIEGLMWHRMFDR